MLKVQSFLLAVVMTVVSLFGSIQLKLDFTRKIPKGYKELTDVSYGESPQQVFDITFPEGIGSDLSLSVYIHGGAWWGGDKNTSYSILYGYFSDRKMLDDMICARVNYRLISESTPEINCETQLQDIDNALKKIVEVCKENGYNVTKAMLWGESAGGHLSTMYCYKYKKTSAVNIGLCYSICGPTDLTDNWYFTTCEIKGQEMATLQKLLTSADITLDNYTGEAAIEARKSVSPIYYVTPDSVPTLYYSGGKDPLVQTSDGEKLAAALKKNGVDHYYMEFPNSPHCGRVKDDYGYCKLFDLHLESMLKKYVKR